MTRSGLFSPLRTWPHSIENGNESSEIETDATPVDFRRLCSLSAFVCSLLHTSATSVILSRKIELEENEGHREAASLSDGRVLDLHFLNDQKRRPKVLLPVPSNNPQPQRSSDPLESSLLLLRQSRKIWNSDYSVISEFPPRCAIVLEPGKRYEVEVRLGFVIEELGVLVLVFLDGRDASASSRISRKSKSDGKGVDGDVRVTSVCRVLGGETRVGEDREIEAGDEGSELRETRAREESKKRISVESFVPFPTLLLQAEHSLGPFLR